MVIHVVRILYCLSVSFLFARRPNIRCSPDRDEIRPPLASSSCSPERPRLLYPSPPMPSRHEEKAEEEAEEEPRQRDAGLKHKQEEQQRRTGMEDEFRLRCPRHFHHFYSPAAGGGGGGGSGGDEQDDEEEGRGTGQSTKDAAFT